MEQYDASTLIEAQAVLSFVIASLLTTIASIAAALLDAAVADPMALLPLWLQNWLSRGLSTQQIENRKLWRRVLDRLILSFADQQLVTGFALLISGYIRAFPGVPGVGDDYINNGAHWNLVVYMSCLSSSTHLACVLTLRKYFGKHKVTAIMRVVLIVLFSLLLIPSIIMSWCFEVFILPLTLLAAHEEEKGRPAGLVLGLWYAFQVLAYVYLFYTAVMQLLIHHHEKIMNWRLWHGLKKILALQFLSVIFRRLLGKRAHDWLAKWLGKLFWYLLFLSPGTVFVLQIFFATTSLVFTLAQKFAKPSVIDLQDAAFDFQDTTILCSLNTTGENTLGFGQLLALAFLALPVFMAYECYTGTWWMIVICTYANKDLEEKHELAHKDGGKYALVASGTPLSPMTPMQQTSSQSSYFQHSPTPSIHQWAPMPTPTQQYGSGLLSPPAPYYNSDYSRLYGEP